ncbi:hypothetical protein CDAR_106951 [Caerostris darwini]|uniref:Uncharacterized protein n=1 Tax=Caerostris darwini TaxID=1538125 RepID=A0AAV4SWU5_9ARAC|nr:hypothetical protein CDAR_106951 [Caerostris darwini]
MPSIKPRERMECQAERTCLYSECQGKEWDTKQKDLVYIRNAKQKELVYIRNVKQKELVYIRNAKQKELVYVRNAKQKAKGKNGIPSRKILFMLGMPSRKPRKMSRAQLNSSISSLRNSLIAIRQSEKKATQKCPDRQSSAVPHPSEEIVCGTAVPLPN